MIVYHATPEQNRLILELCEKNKWSTERALCYIVDQFFDLDGCKSSQNDLFLSPVSSKKTNSKPLIDPLDVEELFRRYDCFKNYSKRGSAKARKNIQARAKEYSDLRSLSGWTELFDISSKSNFLTGKSTDWQADLEWLTRKSSVDKIYSGAYENNSNSSSDGFGLSWSEKKSKGII